MGLDDIAGEAKDLAGQHEDQVDSVIDKGAEAVEEKTPDQADGMIDTAAKKAEDAL